MNRRCRVAAGIALATVGLGAATSSTPPPAPATIVHQGDEPRTMAHGPLAVQGWVVDDEVRAPAPTTTVAPPAPATTEPPPALEPPEPAADTTAPVADTTAPTTAPRRTTSTVYEPPSPQSRTTGRGNEPPAGDAPLACIRSYEQGKAGYATDTGNGYYGAYQFDLQTWAGVGGAGNPAHASPAEQDMRAQMLYDRRGLAPWPTPAVMCR